MLAFLQHCLQGMSFENSSRVSEHFYVINVPALMFIIIKSINFAENIENNNQSIYETGRIYKTDLFYRRGQDNHPSVR
jgi:hypothetical protein